MRQIHCRRFSRPFARLTIEYTFCACEAVSGPYNVVLAGVSVRGVVTLMLKRFRVRALCCVVLRRLMAGAQGCMSCVYAPHVV